MTAPAHAADSTAPTGVLKAITDEEPVLAGAAASWLLADAGDLLAHYHLIGPVQWSGTTQMLLPIVTGVVLGVIGWLVRTLVASPKTQRNLQAAIDAALSAAADAKAATATPIVVQVDGKTVAAAIGTAQPTQLDGLPPVQPSAISSQPAGLQPTPYMGGGEPAAVAGPPGQPTPPVDPAALGGGTP